MGGVGGPGQLRTKGFCAGPWRSRDTTHDHPVRHQEFELPATDRLHPTKRRFSAREPDPGNAIVKVEMPPGDGVSPAAGAPGVR